MERPRDDDAVAALIGSIVERHGRLDVVVNNAGGSPYVLAAESSATFNTKIVQLNMLSRHGARYPTTGSGATVLAAKIHNHTSGIANTVNFTGALSFLNTWTDQLGAEILDPVGKQELFDSGTLHQIM